MGAHHPRHAAPESRRMRRLAVSVIVPVALLTLAAMVWLWPTEGGGAPAQQGGAEELTGQVVAIQVEECAEELPDDVNGC